MQRRDSSRASSHRRPRLMRACTTEPSIMTTSLDHAAMGLSYLPVDAAAAAVSMRSGRRAADLLNHVAYLSACSAAPAHYRSTSRGAASLDPRSGQRRSPLSHAATAAASSSSGPSSRGTAITVSARSSSEGATGRRSECDDVFGSSPASTNTGASLDDDLHRHYSDKYFSFPSFDTWDPDSQYKEDDGKVP